MVSAYLGVVPTNVCEKLVNEASHQGPGRVDSGNELRNDLLLKRHIIQHMRRGNNSSYLGQRPALVTCFGWFCWALKRFIPFSSLKKLKKIWSLDLGTRPTSSLHDSERQRSESWLPLPTTKQPHL